MGDFGYIYGYMLIFAFCLGGLVCSALMHYIFNHKNDKDKENK